MENIYDYLGTYITVRWSFCTLFKNIQDNVKKNFSPKKFWKLLHYLIEIFFFLGAQCSNISKKLKHQKFLVVIRDYN